MEILQPLFVLVSLFGAEKESRRAAGQIILSQKSTRTDLCSRGNRREKLTTVSQTRMFATFAKIGISEK